MNRRRQQKLKYYRYCLRKARELMRSEGEGERLKEVEEHDE